MLNNASGFVFEHKEHLYLVTSRNVMLDEASQYLPCRIYIERYIDACYTQRSTTALPSTLLEAHCARMDTGNRNLLLDESLGLNCA